MSTSVASIIESGLEGVRIDVECHMSNGLPAIIIVGFGNKAVDESRERIRSAFLEAKLELPKKRITINLAPADLPKDGTGFDLAIATAILVASKQVEAKSVEQAIIIGELGLDGSVRAVRGIIGKLIAARKQGFTTFYVPRANIAQAALVPGITLFPVPDLRAMYNHLTSTQKITAHTAQPLTPTPKHHSNDFSEIMGQARAKRAIEIAAAGNHNILLNGAPGTGKSMLAKALPSILPALSLEEVLAVTHLHSLASRQYDTIHYERPFRAPHHTASEVSILGGGQTPRPGEISLAHHGVLFFDELPEYSRATLEALRQPLEDAVITIARAKDTLVYPADFMLVATSNPCPCGYYGTSKSCSCQPYEIQRYQRKLSGPILDRIDMYVTVDEIDHAGLLGTAGAETSQTIKQRVQHARQIQTSRYRSSKITNARLGNTLLKKHAKLTPQAKSLLDQAATKLGISARAYMRILKVARTIADLDSSAVIDVPQVTEALQYRRQTGNS